MQKKFVKNRVTHLYTSILYLSSRFATLVREHRRVSAVHSAKAIRDHVDFEDKLTERFVLSGQQRDVIVINESGLYS